MLDRAQIIKEHITTRTFAESCNIPINRAGFAKCPFHADKDNSLKIYADPKRGWHCFGCKAGGDVISFAARFYGTGFRDTIERLAEDFCIPIPHRKLTLREREELEAAKQRREREKWLADMRKEEVESEYWAALEAFNDAKNIVNYDAPRNADEMPTERFLDALTHLPELTDRYHRAEIRRSQLYAHNG